MSGRLIVVTGCSRGIGRAITEMLIADGDAVIGLSRTAPRPRDGLYWYEWDAQTGGTLADILASEGINDIDALVHCVGTQEPVGPISTSDPEAWAQSVNVNLIGTYRTVRAALPFLERSKDARILLFSGGGAFGARPNFSAYAASKAGVVALMEALAGELPPNVTVNCVAPGFVPTDIHKPTLAAGSETVGHVEYQHATRSADGAMELVVACVRHLLSNNTKGLTGKSISAPYDDWLSLASWNVDAVNRSPVGTRSRHKLAGLNVLAKHPQAVLV